MDNKEITQNTLDAFERYLREDEKSKATIEKYLRDVRHFMEYANGKKIDKLLTMEYKSKLQEDYAVASAIPCLHP